MLYVVFNFVDGNYDDGVQHLCNDQYVGGYDYVIPVDSVLCVTLSCSRFPGINKVI